MTKLIERSWFFRRLGIFGTLCFCWMCGLYILVDGSDTRLMDSAFTSICLLCASTLALYIGGAVYDSRAEGKEAIAAKAVDQSAPTTTETNVEVKQ